MKVKSIGIMALWIAALGVASAIGGCSEDVDATAQAAADKAAADKAAADKAATLEKAELASLPPDLVELRAEITRTTAQMDVTMAKLDTLMVATGDLEEPSAAAMSSMASLDTEVRAIRKRGDEMRDRGAAYFDLWEKQLASMSTPQVAEVATKRKDELAAKYAEVLTAMQESRAALDAYWVDLGAIRTVIDEGLTPEKQKLLAPQVKAAKDKAATLKTRVDTTFAKLSQVSLIFTKR